MKNILQKLNLNESIKSELIAEFDRAVQIEVDELIAEKELKYDDYLNSMVLEQELAYEKYVKDYITEKERSYEEYINEQELAYEKYVKDYITEKDALYESYVENSIDEIKDEFSEKINEYMDRVVEEYVEENEMVMDATIEALKNEAVVEGFSKILETAGVDIAKLIDSKDKLAKNKSIIESRTIYRDVDKTDELINEVAHLKAQNSDLIKAGLLMESIEGLTLLQKDKFLKSSSRIVFNAARPGEYADELDELVESITKPVRVNIEPVDKHKLDMINESRIKNNLPDSKYVSKARHLY